MASLANSIQSNDAITGQIQCQEIKRLERSNEEDESMISESMKPILSCSGLLQLPYNVAHCPEMGRYLVAAKDLRKGDIIFQEFPITSGPERDSPLICPGCYQAPDDNVTCPNCGWPLCGLHCPWISRHQPECDYLSEPLQPVISKNWNILSDYLMLIRCLLMKYNDADRWQNLLDMESNWSQWSRSPLFERAEETTGILRDMFGMTEEKYTTKEILNVQAALDINAYEVRMPYVNIQASYALARLAEHNCVPNTHKTISSESLQLTLRAAVDIQKGANLTTSYCDILWPTIQRQQYLQWSKFFLCSCQRCVDPTELGSLLSALICPKCSEGTLISVLPTLNSSIQCRIQEDFDYICSTCSLNLEADCIESFISQAEGQLQLLDADPRDEKTEEYEKWMARWTVFPAKVTKELCTNNTRFVSTAERDNNCRDIHPTVPPNASQLSACGPSYNEKASTLKLFLHSQHSVVLDACHTLFLSYPKDESTSTEVLQRKIELGLHLLKATKNIIKGISKFRGTVTYEVAITKIASLVRHLEGQDKADESAKRMAQESIELLVESLELLQYEPPDQPEGVLAHTGSRQLQQLEEFLKELIPDLIYPSAPKLNADPDNFNS